MSGSSLLARQRHLEWPAAPGRSIGLALVRHELGRLRRGLATWRGRRSAIRRLEALDDRTLKDVGLYRCDIPSAISAAPTNTGPSRVWRNRRP